MKITKTKIEGIFVIDTEPRGDSRGYFARIFAKEELKKLKIKYDIVHANRSKSQKKGTIRGFHYQKSPKREDKIVQCISGAILDIALDLRKSSKTYGKWVGVELTEENMKMLLIPKGCAHAFQTLKKDTVVEYFVTEYYAPDKERGIRWNDPAFKVKWPIAKPIVSEKDGAWPLYKK